MDLTFSGDLYDYMLGMLDTKDVDPIIAENVEREFEDNSYCDRLYNEIYNARMRLEDRLGTDDDMDLHIIQSRLEDIMRYLAQKMYVYGRMGIAPRQEGAGTPSQAAEGSCRPAR